MTHIREEAEREEKHKTIEEKESWSESGPGPGSGSVENSRTSEQGNSRLKTGKCRCSQATRTLFREKKEVTSPS